MTCLITNDEYHDHTLLDKDRMCGFWLQLL